MDLPIEGHTLRHYTRSRPRPNRRNSKPPSKPQEQAAESEENEANETMGRVDEGVEEFFTKKIIPDDPLKAQREEVPYKAQPTESTSTTPAPPSTSAPAPPSSTTTTSITSSSSSSSSMTVTTTTPSNAPSKNIKKKFGDFFAFKKVRAGRGAKGEGGPEGKVKKTSIADLIRPLREAKEREREKEREKEKGKLEEESGAKATSVNDSDATTTVRAAEDNTMAPAPPSDVPSVPTSLPTSTPAQEEVTSVSPSALTPSPIISPVGGFLAEREKSRTLEKSKTPDGERRLKATRRSLREGKSQSLILLTGLEDGAAAHGRKHASECTSSFEQRLHVMLHRMGVAKTPPADTKTSQNKEEELRKTNSEGAILDKKPEPPPTFMKPRTMSTSASDTRRPIRAGVTSLEALRTDKPLLPGRPIGPLPPKPTVAAKPPLPAPQQHPAAARTSPGVPRQPNTATAPETQTQPAEPETSQSQTQPKQSEVTSPYSRKETPPAPSPHRGPSSLESKERAVRAQSVTEESLPKPQSRMKPSPQRRAVSVYEDSLREHAALLDPKELKAALPRLQKSPVQKRTNLGELPTCSENQQEGEEAGEAGEKKEKERTGEGEGTDSRPVTEDKPGPGPSPVGAGQVEGESTAEKRGETVSQQHTAQAQTSDQRTEPPLMEKHMD
ncbi:hypothetical protein J4Q44_G00093500 [Coregonus suidteri]|uniref:CARMIL C-terminal domain-containing protein n=1 Tax=Coregonus suidteri TaxID=861788 RepID=A0AAN8LZ14_9TELE